MARSKAEALEPRVDLPELAPSDQALLHRFRASESPAAEVVRRIQARLAARISGSELAPLAPVLPLVQIGKAAAIAVAIAAAVLLVLGGSVRIVQAVRTPAVAEQASDVVVPAPTTGHVATPPTVPPRDDRSRVVIPAPVPSEAIPPSEAPPIDLAAVPRTPAPTRRDASARAPAVVGQPAPADAAAEIALFKAARRERDPERRLQLVQEHARRFPGGELVEEVAIIEIESLCALGRRDRAGEVASAFLRAHPESAYAAIARRGCARGSGR